VALAPVAEQLLPERGVSIAQRPVDHDQRLQSDHPVVGLGEAPGERVDAVGDVGERAGGGRGGEDR